MSTLASTGSDSSGLGRLICIKLRGLSSAVSAGNAAMDHIHDAGEEVAIEDSPEFVSTGGGAHDA